MSGPPVHARRRPQSPLTARQVTLLDLLDRLLQGGVVIAGDVTLAVADIDLVALKLRVVVAAIDALAREPEKVVA